MSTRVKLIRKSKNYNICQLTDMDKSCKEKRRIQKLPQKSHYLNSNSENYIYDKDSSALTNLDNNFGDITENLDSVYSHKLMTQNHQQITKATNDPKNKQIRYTAKREKDMKRKKQKNRGKQFSLEEDQRLLSYILKKGPKFYKFSRYFPGKTTNMLKNRYYKSLRFRWDQVLGSQYQHMNEQQDESTPIMMEESPIIMFDELVQLKLFPEMEDLMSNFIGNLSQTLSDINASFPLDN